MEIPKQPTASATAKQLIFTILLVLPLCISCSKKQELPEWMCGSWQSSFNGIDVREDWKMRSDRMEGVTIWSWDGKQRKETLTLQYSGDSLLYTIQMDSNKLCFVCENPFNDTLIFVNYKNDFPKRLVYVKPKGPRMSVWIDNEEKDPNRISFPFEKIPGQ